MSREIRRDSSSIVTLHEFYDIISSSYQSKSSSSCSPSFENSPVIVARVECFKTNTYHHIEDKNPHLVITEILSFIYRGERDMENIKITVNDIKVPISLNDKLSIGSLILETIENEKYFLKESDFLI